MLSAGRNVTAYAAKDLSALKRPEATSDLLLDLGHTDVVFALVVGEGHELAGHEPQSFSFKIAETFKQVTGFGFGDAATFSGVTLWIRRRTFAVGFR